MSTITGPLFPYRETCDPTKPEEAFLWMLVALPNQNGAPLVMPVEYLKSVSKRLWDLGARPVEPPTLKYRPPTGTEPHWLMAPGTWVPVTEPDAPRDPAKRALQAMTAQQKAELLELLLNERNEP